MDPAQTAEMKKTEKILSLLKKVYQNHGTALTFKSEFELAVAVILSAQCTDQRVNIVTKELFKKCRTAKDFSEISQKELEKLIFSTGFYRAKAKNIRAMAKIVHEKYNEKLPRTMKELIQLPGVARKTANVILSEGFGIVEGIAVDTHVKRLSNRLGLVKSGNPEIIERELMELAPKKDWHFISNALIWHGRRVCFARKPNCKECILKGVCPSAFKA